MYDYTLMHNIDIVIVINTNVDTLEHDKLVYDLYSFSAG